MKKCLDTAYFAAAEFQQERGATKKYELSFNNASCSQFCLYESSLRRIASILCHMKISQRDDFIENHKFDSLMIGSVLSCVTYLPFFF